MPADRSLLSGDCQRAFLFPLKNFFDFGVEKKLSMLRYRSRGKKPHRYLTTEYTFIRYVPERGRKSQPNEGAP